MKLLKNSLHIRGDSLYCPLSFSLDSYGNCLTDCVHCYIRRLNEVWGKELKPMDVELFERTLVNGLKNKNPKSPLAWAISQRKTLRFGNKADPFQRVERKHRVSEKALMILLKYKWPTVIETKFMGILMEYSDILAQMKDFLHVMPIISPGYVEDWEKLENKRTTHPELRLVLLRTMKKFGVRVGVNGEPFIPGYHTINQFEEMMKLLNKFEIPSYNVYNLHFNAFVAKRLNEAGIDIEKIWYYNQDAQWKPILQQLIDLAKKYDIILGCPDFVNSGWDYMERSNTCCGVTVDNPCTFNAMTWKRLLQQNGNKVEKLYNDIQSDILEDTWDGVGDFDQGIAIMYGETKDMYTMMDIK